MKPSFNKWLQSIGYKSYIDYRNSMFQQGFNLMFIESGWRDIEQRYKECTIIN